MEPPTSALGQERGSVTFQEDYDTTIVSYLKRKEWQKVIDFTTETLRQNSRHLAAYLHRAVAHSSLGSYSFAIHDCNRALEINANYAQVYRMRGICHYHLNNKDLASNDFIKSLQLNPSDSQTKQWLNSLDKS